VLVAVIAHDLRSPIAAIGLSLDQALRHTADPNATVAVSASVLQRMRRSARQLGAMVGDLSTVLEDCSVCQTCTAGKCAAPAPTDACLRAGY
jgi:signal transduction histidine kinase